MRKGKKMNNAVLTRLAGRIINVPIMIHPDKLNAILGVVGPRIGLAVSDDLMQSDWSQGPERDDPPDKDSIAIIPVYDSLVYRSFGLMGLSGLTSYERIRARFREALNDDSKTAILFDIDSPGGEVAGVFDLVDEIYEARGQKPIYAIANEDAYSAAYALASAADKLYLPRTGGMGSIGVIAVHVDRSSFNEKVGFSYTAIYAGKHKTDFSPYKPLSDDAKATAQADINEVYALFVETVARNRGMNVDDVAATEAAIFQGQHAVDAGLADGVMSYDQVINEILSNQNKGGFQMNNAEMKDQMEALLTNPDVDAGAVLAELGYIPRPDESAQPDVDVEQITADATEAGRKEAMDRVTGIMDLCKLAGMPEMASDLIKEGVSVEDARKKVLDAKAADSGKDEIISTVSGTSTGEINPLMADAEKRKKEAEARHGK